jgi:hypothetical protein
MHIIAVLLYYFNINLITIINLNTGKNTAFFHAAGNIWMDKVRLKVKFTKGVGISVKPFIR